MPKEASLADMGQLSMLPEAFQKDARQLSMLPGGYEAAAPRRFVESMPDGFVVAKLDFVNASTVFVETLCCKLYQTKFRKSTNYVTSLTVQFSSSTDFNFSLTKVSSKGST